MNRFTRRALLQSGFHVVIHSTGALVVRNWIRLFRRRPSPIANLVHLAGANFGSGLAHLGQGQAARWGRLIFQGVGRGARPQPSRTASAQRQTAPSAGTVDLANLRPGSPIDATLRRLDGAGYGKPSRLGNLLTFLSPILQDVFQSQRLVLIEDEGTLRRAGVQL